MVYEVFDKKFAGGGASTLANNEIKQNLQLAEELHITNIRNFKKKNSLFQIQRQYVGC